MLKAFIKRTQIKQLKAAAWYSYVI